MTVKCELTVRLVSGLGYPTGDDVAEALTSAMYGQGVEVEFEEPSTYIMWAGTDDDVMAVEGVEVVVEYKDPWPDSATYRVMRVTVIDKEE